jgi:rubrerythrin
MTAQSAYTPVIDGFSGFPIQSASERHGAAPGSIEWLMDAVERHALAERDALDQYEYLGSASGDSGIALVMRLILEDEQRHHGLLKRIEASLRDALNWTHSPDALPVTVPQEPIANDLAQLARELIEEEHTGARYLRNLAHQQKGIGSGLHSLLIEMMAMDSEKHARLLQYVHDRLAARARVEDGPSD